MYNCLCGSFQRLGVFAVTGLLKNTDFAATILSIGRDESAYEFARVVCSRIDSFRFLGRIFCWQINPRNFSGFEVMGICTPKQYLNKFEKSGNFVLPEVTFSLDLNGSMDSLTGKMSRRRRRDIKKLLALGYSYVVSTKSPEEFALFYSKMYVPYVRNRFKNAACIRPYLKSWSLYSRGGGILFVKSGDALISGIQFQTRGRTVYALALGVSEDNTASTCDCAGQAALFFLIQWAKAQGFARLNYGPTMPFLKDGIFVYKKEWGMVIEDKADPYYFALRLGCSHERAMVFLQKNPFLFLDKGLIKALIFVSRENEQTPLTELASEYFLKGLDSLVVVDCELSATKDKSVNVQLGPSIFAGRLPQPLLEIGARLNERSFNLAVREIEFSHTRERP
jgi:hypothetical protein